MQLKFLFTYSEEERLAVFLPIKTGTIHTTFILNHFNFRTNIYGKDDRLILEEDYLIHHHNEILPKEYEDYDVIYTTRNPYTRILSMYFYEKKVAECNGPYTKTFKEYFSERANFGWGDTKSGFNFIKTPKYILRMENLYHDYIQIPFIRDSKLNESGILSDLCEKKIHAKKQETKPLNEYYTQDMADHVYETFKPYFDLTGYDKDSWKV
jgi:hypothetical protein